MVHKHVAPPVYGLSDAKKFALAQKQDPDHDTRPRSVLDIWHNPNPNLDHYQLPQSLGLESAIARSRKKNNELKARAQERDELERLALVSPRKGKGKGKKNISERERRQSRRYSTLEQVFAIRDPMCTAHWGTHEGQTNLSPRSGRKTPEGYYSEATTRNSNMDIIHSDRDITHVNAAYDPVRELKLTLVRKLVKQRMHDDVEIKKLKKNLKITSKSMIFKHI